MKTSYFNPEVHSFTFINFNHVVCGVSWGAQCGGMCCTVLSKFYKGELIDCESAKSNFEGDIWNNQLGIIGSDCYKSCRWGDSLNAINGISQNIELYHKPTLLYLDQVDWSLTEDHFVVAYAIDDIVNGIQKVYVYDPNYAYKRHFCSNPEYRNNSVKNFQHYLEVNYNNQTVSKQYENRTILGFKWYGQNPTGIPVSHYTDERNIQHSSNINLVRINPPQIIGNKPVISHTIEISKNGNVPADLKLKLKGGPDLYESGQNLFPYNLNNVFNGATKYIGLQTGKGSINQSFKVYQNYAPSNTATIILQSNLEEKSLQLPFPKPAIENFSAYIKGAQFNRESYSHEHIDKQIIKVQGLDKNSVVEVEKIKDGYSGPLPSSVARVYYNEDEWQEGINTGAFTLFKPIFYLGYIKSNIVIELMHNGLYTNASAIMTPDGQSPVNSQFNAGMVTFTLPGGNKTLYDTNATKTINFKVSGSGITSEFIESFSAVLQYRCLIIHEPVMKRPIDKYYDIDIFARYFGKLLINNPHLPGIPEMENKFKKEFAKHQDMDKEKFKEIFSEQIIKRFEVKSKTILNRKELLNDFIDSYNVYDSYRKDRTDFILTRSKNFQELKLNFDILEDQMRPVIGRILSGKKTFKKVIKNVLKSEWRQIEKVD